MSQNACCVNLGARKGSSAAAYAFGLHPQSLQPIWLKQIWVIDLIWPATTFPYLFRLSRSAAGGRAEAETVSLHSPRRRRRTDTLRQRTTDHRAANTADDDVDPTRQRSRERKRPAPELNSSETFGEGGDGEDSKHGLTKEEAREAALEQGKERNQWQS